MEVSIKINNGSSESHLDMKGASQESEAAIIAGFFNQMGTVVHPEPIKQSGVPIDTSKLQKIAAPLKPFPKEAAFAKAESRPIIKENPIDNLIEKALRPEASKRLPLVGQSERGLFPIEEIAKIKEFAKAEKQSNAEPEHWKTGIKTDEDGTKRYKCHYRCQCGDKGNRYIPLGFDFIFCRACDAEIDVKPATTTGKVDTDGAPERDAFGCFFTAFSDQ